MRRDLLSIALVSLFLIIPSSGTGAQVVVYDYQETFGSESWGGRTEAAVTEPGISLSYRSPRETHRFGLDARLDGLDWAWERSGRTLVLEGFLGGREKKAEKEVGDLPWFQAPDYSLSLVASRPDVLLLGGQPIPAVKVALSAAGVPELVWKNEYQPSPEGEYLGFKGRPGGPFSPAGSLIFIKKEVSP